MHQYIKFYLSVCLSVRLSILDVGVAIMNLWVVCKKYLVLFTVRNGPNFYKLSLNRKSCCTYIGTLTISGYMKDAFWALAITLVTGKRRSLFIVLNQSELIKNYKNANKFLSLAD